MERGAPRHRRFMTMALRLARRAQGETTPNPAVGAVLVRAGRVVGRGYHRRAGFPHAEIEALRQGGARARGATLYVTLEPCNHVGRTPPCCDALIAVGITHVVAAVRDPNPLTNGRGIARLRRAGIRVTMGVMATEAQRLNEPFFTVMRRGRPLVIAKAAQSLDGKIATVRGESRWITSPAARALSHQWRRRVDAILVGITTVLRDDPLLSARPSGRRRSDRPVKVIVDSRLRIPLTARCLSNQSPAPTIVATTVRAPTRRRSLERRGVEVLTFSPLRGPRPASNNRRPVPAKVIDGPGGGRVPLTALCRALVRRGIQSLLIEGGGEVLASAFAERIVDRIVWFVAPTLIGGRGAPGALGGQGTVRLASAVRLTDVTVQRVGPDLCLEGRVVYPQDRGVGRGARGGERLKNPRRRRGMR